MKQHFWTMLAALLAMLAGSTAAAAQAPVTLHGDVKVEKTVDENGAKKIVLIEPRSVVPGDRLIFSTAFHNGGASKVEHFVVTNPLPKGVTYVADPADSGEVSVDGGKSWGPLMSLTVVDAASGARRPAQAGDVTHVRWTVAAIAPGGDGVVTYHAVVR